MRVISMTPEQIARLPPQERAITQQLVRTIHFHTYIQITKALYYWTRNANNKYYIACDIWPTDGVKGSRNRTRVAIRNRGTVHVNEYDAWSPLVCTSTSMQV